MSIVIGGGITGTIIANQLKHVDLPVQVLEQSNNHGRLKTEEADVGAQFFTVRSEEFKELVDHWEDQELVKVWSKGFPPKNDGNNRYCAVDGMEALVDHLSQSIDIQYETTVESIQETDKEFVIKTNHGELKSDHVILTAPLPKSVDLVKHILPKDDLQELQQVEYYPCISLVITLDKPLKISDSGAYQLKGKVVDFVANNHTKGVTNDDIITIHCSPDFSEQYFNAKESDIIVKVQQELSNVNELKSIPFSTVKMLKWDYSQPKQPYKQSSYSYKNKNKLLVIAGDGFGSSKIEGACLSALDASNTLFKDYQVFQ